MIVGRIFVYVFTVFCSKSSGIKFLLRSALYLKGIEQSLRFVTFSSGLFELLTGTFDHFFGGAINEFFIADFFLSQRLLVVVVWLNLCLSAPTPAAKSRLLLQVKIQGC